jgi:hypothetical protein
MVNKKDTLVPAKGTTTDHWYGFTYKWDADQKEARLVPSPGQNDSIRIWPQGTKKPARWKKWVFPARNACERCHLNGRSDSLHARSVLGFFTAQLNRPHPDSAGINQLDYFFAAGVVKGKKPYLWDYAPRWRPIEDNSASLDVRARSYIAANCSGCHGRRGMENHASEVSLNYDFHAMQPQMEFRHRMVSWPFGLDTIPPAGMAKNPNDQYFYPKNDPNNPDHLDSLLIVPALVVPGYPEKSVILFRQRSRNTRPSDYDPVRDQMPPSASYEVNEPATALIEKWIKEMPVPVPIATALLKRHAAGAAGFFLQGRRLILDAKASAGDLPVEMAGVDGRRVALRRIAAGTYAIPESLPKGLYLIRVGARSALRYLL